MRNMHVEVFPPITIPPRGRINLPRETSTHWQSYEQSHPQGVLLPLHSSRRLATNKAQKIHTHNKHYELFKVKELQSNHKHDGIYKRTSGKHHWGWCISTGTFSISRSSSRSSFPFGLSFSTQYGCHRTEKPYFLSSYIFSPFSQTHTLTRDCLSLSVPRPLTAPYTVYKEWKSVKYPK